MIANNYVDRDPLKVNFSAILEPWTWKIWSKKLTKTWVYNETKNCKSPQLYVFIKTDFIEDKEQAVVPGPGQY